VDYGSQGVAGEGEESYPATRCGERGAAATPWVKVDKEYVFDALGQENAGRSFRGRSQLIVYHFMLARMEGRLPELLVQHGSHGRGAGALAQRDVTFAAISRATLPQIEASRSAWDGACVGVIDRNDFNRDYHVSFTRRKANGKSIQL